MSRVQALILLMAVMGVAPAASGQPSAGATGTWLDESGRAGITIAPCGEKLCGSISWLKAPLDASGKPKHDIHNENAALRDRPLCGLTMLGNFTEDGPNAWSGGFIYDPEKGETYKSTMHLQPDNTLRVRGYIGIPLLGRSEIWTRPASPLGHCS